MGPLVSVCVPIHNGERFLSETLACILAQDFADFEVVALNNASTDSTEKILREVGDPRLRVHVTERLLPLPANWRRVVELARGRYVKVVCADDLISPQCLSSQVEVLESERHISLVACRRQIVSDTGRTVAEGKGLRGLLGRRRGRDVALQAAWLGHNPIGESAAVMFEKAAYDRVGGWDGSLVYPMDLDLWLKLLKVGDLYGQREAMATYRVSSSSLTAQFTRRQYREQYQFMTTMALDPDWGLGWPARVAARATSVASLAGWELRHMLTARADGHYRRRGSA